MCVCVCARALSKHKQRCLPSLAWTSIGECSASAARGSLDKCFSPSLPRPVISSNTTRQIDECTVVGRESPRGHSTAMRCQVQLAHHG